MNAGPKLKVDYKNSLNFNARAVIFGISCMQLRTIVVYFFLLCFLCLYILYSLLTNVFFASRAHMRCCTLIKYIFGRRYDTKNIHVNSILRNTKTTPATAAAAMTAQLQKQ